MVPNIIQSIEFYIFQNKVIFFKGTIDVGKDPMRIWDKKIIPS